MQAIKDRGFCDAETWSLRSMTAEWILPRLKRFREIDAGHPSGISAKAWNAIVDEMIFAFAFWADEPNNASDKLYKRAEHGLRLFAKWFPHLWW